MAGEINLEVIEGPDAGKQIAVDRAIVIGRDAGSDLVLDDGEVSGQHARVTPAPDGSATVEDLESTNGTFVNQNELEGPARLDPGDHLLIGVSVLELRTRQDIASRASAVIQIPPAMAMAPREPTYVNPEVRRVDQAPRSCTVRRRRAPDGRQVPRREGAPARPARAARAVHSGRDRTDPVLLAEIAGAAGSACSRT